MQDNFTIDFENTAFVSEELSKFSDINRANWRCEFILSRNKHEIEGKRILDLTSNNGKFSYACAKLGAKSVTGVEVRENLIEQSTANTAEEFGDTCSFIQGDLFEYLPTVEPGQFDTILCLGFFYHTTRQIEFMEQMRRINPACLIIDTTVWKSYFTFSRKGLSKGPCLFFAWEDPDLDRMTVDTSGIVGIPTVSFIQELFKLYGFDCESVDVKKVGIKNWSGLEDYKKIKRYACLLRPTSGK
jgi:SAM-dependent methyltransferase